MFAEISVAVGNRHVNVQVNYTAMFAWLCLIYLVMVDWLGTLEVKKAVDGYKGGECSEIGLGLLRQDGAPNSKVLGIQMEITTYYMAKNSS